MTTSLEFIDYIFDRYVFLGVSPTASFESLRSEIRRRRAENHPDKLVHVSDAIRATATRQMDLVNNCARVLLDEAIREQFDIKLGEFYAKAPHLVSTSGTPIIDPTRFKVDLDALLDAKVQDLSELEIQAAQMAGYNAKRLERARVRWAKEPADFDAREQLRDELTTKLVHLSVMEDYYWARAGVAGAVQRNTFDRAAHPHEVLSHLAETVNSIQENMERAVRDRHAVAQLGMVPMLLLGHHTSDANAEQVAREVALVARKAFELRIEDLKALVVQKKETLDELLAVSRSHMVHPATASGIIDIMLIQSEADLDENWPGPEFTQLGLILRLDIAEDLIILLGEIATPEELANWPHELHLLEPNREVPGLFLEAVALAEKQLAARNAQ